MIAGNIENKKQFMAQLLKSTVFDNLLVRSIVLKTSVLYEIDCTIDKTWFNDDEQEGLERFAKWSDMRHIVFELIKGNRLPGYIKIVLSPTDETAEKIHKNAAALFINILFENNVLSVTTGCSEKQFAMDKAVERTWDESAQKFFKHNSIIIE